MFCLLFLVSPVCIAVGFAGEIHFPRTPISYSVPGFHFPRVAPLPPAAEDFVLLTCPPAAANSSPPASRAAAEGLRSAAFTFVALAPRCPLRLPPNRAVRSHPLRGAYRAFLARRQCCFVSHTRYYAQSRLYCDILSDQIEGTLAHIDVLTVLNPLLFPRVQQLEFLRRANRAFQ